MEEPAAAVPHTPLHAHLWLTAEQQDEWVASKKQVPTLVFASFVAFNMLSFASLRIINRKGLVKHPKNIALLQIGVTALTHAIISLAAAVYLAVHRDLKHCGEQAFCHDDISARLMDMHAGFALFEWLFWQNNAQVAAPWTEMLLLHNVVQIMMVMITRMYPSRLSLLLLPLYEFLQLSTLADCARRLATIFRAPWHIRFKLQLAMLFAFGIKMVAAAGICAYSFMWIRDNDLWQLELPEDMSMLNNVYGMIYTAGTIILALIYVKWFGAAVSMTNDLMDAVEGKKAAPAGAGATAQAAAAKTLTSGNRKKEKQRRG